MQATAAAPLPGGPNNHGMDAERVDEFLVKLGGQTVHEDWLDVRVLADVACASPRLQLLHAGKRVLWDVLRGHIMRSSRLRLTETLTLALSLSLSRSDPLSLPPDLL